MGVMQTPYPNIEKDMEFTKLLIVMQKLEENWSLGTELYNSVWILETNNSRSQ
jgi:hypothetical protein